MKHDRNRDLFEDDDEDVDEVGAAGQERVDALHEGRHHSAGHQRNAADECLRERNKPDLP